MGEAKVLEAICKKSGEEEGFFRKVLDTMSTHFDDEETLPETVVCILHELHPQAGDDEEESGPNVSHVTGPEESAVASTCHPFPHMTRYEETATLPPTPHTPGN